MRLSDPTLKRSVKPFSIKLHNTRSTATLVCAATKMRKPELNSGGSSFSLASTRNMMMAASSVDLPL